MSSFICSPKHFNSVEFSIQNLAYGSEFYFPYSFKNKFAPLYDKRSYSTKRIEQTISEVINTLREINALCVCLQYKSHYEGRLDNEIETQTQILLTHKKERTNLPKIGLYKALRCIEYQIETNHLKELRELTEKEENAMFFLKSMIDKLAHDIVQKLPEFDSANWEFN